MENIYANIYIIFCTVFVLNEFNDRGETFIFHKI